MTRQPERAPTWAPAGFFHLRTPLLPFDEFLAFNSDLAAAQANSEAALEAALVRDRALLMARLRSLLSRPIVREALYLASPDLDEQLEAWVGASSEDKDVPHEADPSGEAESSVGMTVYNYFARMSGRSTPFGLFAGCSLGTTGAGHRLELASRERYRRLTELDSGHAAALADALALSLGDSVVVRHNASLYAAAGRLRYFAAERRPGGPLFRLEAITPDAFLQAALARSRDGATLADVARAVASVEESVATADAGEYVRDLLARDILVADLEPALTGRPLLQDLIARVGNYPGAFHARDRLLAVRVALGDLDAAPLGVARERYRVIQDALAPLGGGRATFQVDLAKPCEAAVLGDEVVRELHAGTLVLQRLFRERASRSLTAFRERFVERYEQREVPLVEALDEECGIGFTRASGPNADPSPLLAGLSFPDPGDAAPTLSPAMRWLLPKVSEVLRTGATELGLDNADLERWEREARLPPSDPLPDAFSAIGMLAAEDEVAVAAGHFRVLHLGAGAQGASLLGRFCLRDEALRVRVEGYLRAEEALRPDAVFAEIVYRPEARLANVTRRPVLRGHEIPVLGRSGAPLDRQIALTDLMISVVGRRVRLRSARLNREVLPRLTSALDAGRGWNIGVVRFLVALQTQEGVGVVWAWGPLAALPVLPRVVAGRVVLSRARWLLDAALVKRLRASRGAARFRVVESFRAHAGVPRHVGLQADGAATLPLDLENALAIDALVRLAEPGASLAELFPSPGELSVRGPEGRYMHELVVPFIREPADGNVVRTTLSRARAPAPVAPDARSVLPGGEWFYVRLYGGRATADRLLTEFVAPLVRSAIAQGTCDRWFFIRYDEPHDHLRIRLHGDPERVARDFTPHFHEAMQRCLASGMIWRVQLDTYEREVERYGGLRAMSLSEQVFAADSDAVVEMLEACDEPGERWRYTLLGLHHLLLDLGLDTAQRLTLLVDAETEFGREFRADPPFWARLGAKARTERATLDTLLAAPIPAWLGERSRRLAPLVEALRAEDAAGRLTVPFGTLARHYLHLHVNRALRSSWREQELVLVSLLARHCKALRARGPAAADPAP